MSPSSIDFAELRSHCPVQVDLPVVASLEFTSLPIDRPGPTVGVPSYADMDVTKLKCPFEDPL
jgi:hypothetical protein